MCGLSGCGYPHVRLVMHVLNCSRHATARPKSSRHVDELRDERAYRTVAGPGDRGAVGKHKASSALTLCPPRCFLKLSVGESQLSRADYARPTGRKVP